MVGGGGESRCLVKMQKRGKGNCPLCRAPTVLQADRCTSLIPHPSSSLYSLSFIPLRPTNDDRRTMNGGTANVDWALLNFMQDWFPEETKEKARQNEKEAAEEMMKELGWEGKQCLIM